MRPGTFGPALLLLACSAGCIDGQLNVDITTVIQGDGSCTRRVVYEYRATPNPDADPLTPMAAESDPLRQLHRFPTDERWTIQHDVRAATHTVTMDGRFRSPNEIDWDYWRTATPKARPARNHFSFAMEEEGATSRFEYAEAFLDPASPIEWLRHLAQLLSQKEKPLAQALHRGLGRSSVAAADVRRALHEDVVAPLVVEVSRLSSRPVFGPREKHEAETLLDRLDEMTQALVEHLISLSPGLDAEAAKEAVDAAFEAVAGEGDLDTEGAAIFVPGTVIKIHATLTMPAPILRANTCFQGDTATWDFDGSDLYGRGFEMSAVAATQ
jgi:hypothetical protein